MKIQRSTKLFFQKRPTKQPFSFRWSLYQDVPHEKRLDMKDHCRDDRDALLKHTGIASDPFGLDTEVFLSAHDQNPSEEVNKSLLSLGP